MAKKVEEVRDGFLGDLPEDLRIKIMNLHKVIVDKVRAEMKRPKYASIANSTWAKGWLEEFLAEPTDKNHIGSVRVYKKGKRYSCMIQISGHVSNLRNTEDEDLFHALIRNAFTAIRPIARRKFDFTLTCESEHGEPFEGFDVWTKQKVAAEIWNNWNDKKTKDIKPMKESYDPEERDILIAEMSELPEGLQRLLVETSYKLFGEVDDQCGYTELMCESDNYSGSIFLAEAMMNTDSKELYESFMTEFENDNPGKFLSYDEETNSVSIELESVYVEKLMDAIEEYCAGECRRLSSGKIEVSPELLRQFRREANVHDEQDENRKIIAMNAKNTEQQVPMTIRKGYVITPEEKEKMEEREREKRLKENPRSAFDDFTLVANNNGTTQTGKSGYHHSFMHRENVEYTEAAVDKSMINAVGKNIISGNKTYTQKDADILSSIITTKYLGQWSKYHKKFEIKLSDKIKVGTFEFVLPKIGPDFVSNLLNGKTSIMELVNKNDTITVKMNSATFKTMKKADDLYTFFYGAVKYYTHGIIHYNKSLCHALMNMNKQTQLAITKTNLHSIVVASIQMLFVFDKVDMSNVKTFNINADDLNTLESFLTNITSRYKSPKNEQTAIVNDLNKMIQSFRESFDDIQFGLMANEVAKYYEGGYDKTIQTLMEQFKADQINIDWYRESTDPQVRYYQEKFGVKKLKKIPKDTVAYITIETESIKDANDKMMIASYCLDKIEIVEWYIELIDAKSTKYIVPHTRPYLESMRTQLLACYKKIMDTPIPKADRPIIDIKYPKGYEG